MTARLELGSVESVSFHDPVLEQDVVVKYRHCTTGERGAAGLEAGLNINDDGSFADENGKELKGFGVLVRSEAAQIYIAKECILSAKAGDESIEADSLYRPALVEIGSRILAAGQVSEDEKKA
jgi:hypothetical protein